MTGLAAKRAFAPLRRRRRLFRERGRDRLDRRRSLLLAFLFARFGCVGGAANTRQGWPVSVVDMPTTPGTHAASSRHVPSGALGHCLQSRCAATAVMPHDSTARLWQPRGWRRARAAAAAGQYLLALLGASVSAGAPSGREATTWWRRGARSAGGGGRGSLRAVDPSCGKLNQPTATNRPPNPRRARCHSSLACPQVRGHHDCWAERPWPRHGKPALVPASQDCQGEADEAYATPLNFGPRQWQISQGHAAGANRTERAHAASLAPQEARMQVDRELELRVWSSPFVIMIGL